MSEDPGERARAYLGTVEKDLEGTKAGNNPEVLKVIDYVKRYMADCRYFLETGKPTTALASIAYAEGLLDSLSILGLTQPSRPE